jgi:hypothetical protein
MPTTPYDPSQKDDSDRAHMAARTLLYPRAFKVDPSQLVFSKQEDLKTSEEWAALDGKLAIDRVVNVSTGTYRNPLRFTVQERFRQPENAKWQDLTITEWNNRTNLPSELYKLNADFFMYGYFDQVRRYFLDAIVINVSAMKLALIQGVIGSGTKTNPRSDQEFITITFSELHRAGLVIYRHQPVKELAS